MKRHLYLLCVVVAFSGLIACSKNNDPAPASPVVGRWELNRGILSSFPTSTTSNVNGAALDLRYFQDTAETIDIFADNTFNSNYRNVVVGDFPGSWSLSDNTLTLKFDNGEQDVFTYSKNKNIEEIAVSTPQNYTLGSAVGKIQWVYRK